MVRRKRGARAESSRSGGVSAPLATPPHSLLHIFCAGGDGAKEAVMILSETALRACAGRG